MGEYLSKRLRRRIAKAIVIETNVPESEIEMAEEHWYEWLSQFGMGEPHDVNDLYPVDAEED